MSYHFHTKDREYKGTARKKNGEWTIVIKGIVTIYTYGTVAQIKRTIKKEIAEHSPSPVVFFR